MTVRISHLAILTKIPDQILKMFFKHTKALSDSICVVFMWNTVLLMIAFNYIAGITSVWTGAHTENNHLIWDDLTPHQIKPNK